MKETEDFEGAAATPAHATYVRCAAYARSATSRAGELQLEALRETARRYGLDVADADFIAADPTSAKIDGRPGIQKLRQKVERGEISPLICLDWSRLSRNSHDAHEIKTVLENAGVKVVTANDGDELGDASGAETVHTDRSAGLARNQ